MLGLRLQQLRKDLGRTQEYVGEETRMSASTISRIESGAWSSLDRRGLIRLLTYYGITDTHEHEKYLSLVQLGTRPGWWHRDSDFLPKGFELFNLESAARTIRCYEPAVVPELLQTAEYARAALRLRYPGYSGDKIEWLLEVRLRRQEILASAEPPFLWIVVEESALRRPIGGTTVWRKQIDHLEQMLEAENIRIHIVGDAACGPAVVGHAFMYIRFTDRRLPDVVCISQPTSTLYMGDRKDVDRYLLIAEQLALMAARPSAAVPRLRALKNDAEKPRG
ncbi:helix-turn-helix domain-containing protein [Nocardia sp. NPDC049149]|uniref:helix-turn-helix domain-containing protein n=1 Tax=Nocardia sp. NPDC049149 TaxID=3364315 RepID=UPI0037111D53